MNNHHPQHTPDADLQVTGRVVDAFEQTDIPARPDTAQTLRWLESQPKPEGDAPAARDDTGGDGGPYNFRRFAMRVLSPLAVAALVLLTLTMSLWLPSGFNSNAVFAQAVEQLRSVQTMAFTLTMSAPGQPVMLGARATVKNPGWMRLEMKMEADDQKIDIIQIMDHESQQMVVFVPQQQVAQRVNMEGMPRSENPHDIIAEFSRLDPEQATYLRDEELDGVETHVYRIDAGPMNGHSWIDAETKRPLRMEFGNPATPDDPDAGIVMEAFEWDVPTADWMFDMTIPDEYQVRDMDMSNAQPEDLAMTLRLFAALSEAPLPASFGPEAMGGLGALLHKPELTHEENKERITRLLAGVYGDDAVTDARIQKTVEDMAATMGRGALFMAGLAETAEDWQWVGGGVSSGDGDVPLCWWKPKDAELYRVIYNDFTLKEIAPDELPDRPE